MKNIILLSSLLVIAAFATAQTTATTAVVTPPVTETIQVNSLYDFGKIPQGRPATYVFEITNTGKEALKIDNVQASCGCTTPVWSKDPVAPGSTTKITVGYNSYAEGYFEKTINVQYNGSQSKVLTLKGTVYKAPPASAPENASVKLLKQASAQASHQ
jgi:Protein of unknown function (DUF1573)